MGSYQPCINLYFCRKFFKMLTDTHSHIYSGEFNGEIDDVMNRAWEAGVNKILLPNIDSSSIKMMLDLTDKYPETCFPMIGIHPTSVKEDFKEELELVEFWLAKRTFYGIGEIGIDLYWDKTFREEQEYVFCHQLRLAHQYQLPVSIHIRESFEVVMENLKKENLSGIKGVFHCFSGNTLQAREVIEMGFKIGIGGTVTFKNSGVEKIVEDIEIENIVIETDSPYLAPVPFRGKRNESSHIVLIARRIAQIKGISEEEVARITSENAASVFPI